MSIFINKKTGKLVTADSKNEVLALNVDRLSWKVKELYNKLNKGDFEYNYRVDEDFQKFIDNTVCDEIKDIIRSSKQLINDCVGKRIKTHSIVWKCMGLIFDEVKERNGLATTYNSETIKNWFAFNNTDYKTALKNVISDIDDFRDELRETEKDTEVKSSKTTASIMISCEKGLDNLEGKIKEFKKLLTRITAFIARRKSKYKYVVEDDVFGSTECSHIWRITNNEDKSISIKLTLDDGFTTYNVKCFVRYGRDSYSQTQNPWKYIEDFLD
jgi:hypothetical protein